MKTIIGMNALMGGVVMGGVLLMSSMAIPGNASSTNEAPPYAALLAKAKERGFVRVIIGLKNPRPDESSIAQLQDELLVRLQKFNISHIKKYTNIPYLHVKIDLPGLECLIAAPSVASVEEDKEVRIRR